MIEKRLEHGDKIQRSYAARYNGINGYFVLSKNKLLFIEEKGFLHKKYNLILDIPYEKIDEVTVENYTKLTLTDEGGRRHNFMSIDVSSSVIEEKLKELAKMVRTTA